MSYYENSQWSGAGQSGWDHQTPPVRSGASSAVPREDGVAFTSQIEEVDRAMDNLVKSGKMYGMPNRHGRAGPNAGPRSHSGNDYSDSRGGHQSNLQNFYATQRHQSSRGSNEAEQMMQAKRRMAAQRERELRNYHQEQQYNRTGLSDISTAYGDKTDRTLSPGSMSENERRDLIARQRSALYGEGPFAETGGYVDETGTPRPGMPPHQGPGALRRHSPLAYEYGRTPPAEGGPQGPVEGGPGSQSAGHNQRSRANSTSSPQSNPAGNKGVFDAPGAQQSSRTSTSSPGEAASTGKSGPGGGAVAPIGTRPSGAQNSGPGSAVNPALNRRDTTPLSPLNYSGPGGNDSTPTTSGAPNPEGLSGWGRGSGVWGNGKSGLGTASVWG